MINPLIALAVFAVLSGSLCLLFWPDRGLYWRWQRMHRKSELVNIEDALKHIYDCEYTNRTATVDSVAGCLEISSDRAVDLIQRLEDLELLTASDETLHLTPAGRQSALRVIRIHRLWERYLADRTGQPQSTWHGLADRWEHKTSPAQADSLAARLGSPRFDPHGDPIPLSDGEMPEHRGTPLTNLDEGDRATIVHVEDEPPAIYAQLLAEGLHPGMTVRVIEATPTRIQFEADAEEIVLAPIVAANITVVPLVEPETVELPFERLSDLKIAQRARVVGISPACRSSQMRRLLDLGLVPGTEVQAELDSPRGDPTAYRVRGALIALRDDQARLVYVTCEEPQVA